MGWLDERRLRRQVSMFWEMLGDGRVAAALALFDEQLREDHNLLEPGVRVIYHLHRWLESPRDEHVEAVLIATKEEGVSPSVVRAARIMMHLHRLRGRARAVRHRAWAIPGGVERDESLSVSEPYEHMAVAIGLIYGVGTDVRAGANPEMGRRVLHELPPEEELSGKAKLLRRRLALWARMLIGDYEQVLALARQPGAVEEATASRVQLMAAERRFQSSLATGSAADATAALVSLAWLLDAEQLLAHVIIALAGAVTDTSRSPLLADFLGKAEALLLRRAERDGDRHTARFVEIVLLRGLLAIRSGNVEAGRRDVRAAYETASSEKSEVRNQGAIRAQALIVLMCLQLSAVKSWPRVRGTGEMRRTTAAGNRTLWTETRRQLREASVALGVIDHPDAPFGPLVAGFISYVDSGRLLSESELDSFSRAITKWEARGSVSRLRSIQTALNDRCRATGRALELIEKRGFVELAELYRRVLEPLGAAVSPLVRMAVIMTLWEEERIEDASSALEVIEVEPQHQAFVERCLLQVHIREVLGMLTAACRSSDGDVPPTVGVPPHGDAAEAVGFATALIHLRHGRWREALAALPALQAETDLHAKITFYAGWMLGDMDRIRRLDAGPVVRQGSVSVGKAIAGRCLIVALESEDDMALDGWFQQYVTDGDLSARVVLGVALDRLGGAEPKKASRILRAVRRTMGQDVDGLEFVEGLVAARLGEMTTALSVFSRSDELVGGIWGDQARVERIVHWGRLFCLVGELGQAAQSNDLVQRWPSIRRSLDERALAVDGSPMVQAYVDLMQGVLAYLCSDQMVDQDVLVRLDHARRVLRLERCARFLEDVVSRLRWRRDVLEGFWRKLMLGEFADCRAIYAKELVVFEDRLPQSITLAMLVVDWEQGREPRDLLARMDGLEQRAGRLAVVQRLRDQVENGMRFAELERHIRGRDFDGIVDFIRSTPWAGFEPGSMPLPAAIALLYALAQKEENERALGLGSNFESAQRFPQWVQDQAGLILGYVRFRARDFDGAAATFESISKHELLGHDVDRYWAAAHFSRGLELLDADKKSEAFDAFARSVGRREGASTDVANLSPLFAHFGLKNIEAESGARALQAFELLEESVEGAEPADRVLRDRFLAKVGVVLCHCLIDDANVPVDGYRVLKLLEILKRDCEALGDKAALQFERAIRLMALCQELKLVRRRELPKKDLLERLDEFTRGVQSMVQETGRQEPPLLVLLGMRKLLLGPKDVHSEALELLGQAMRLGVNSARLTRIIQQRELLRIEAQKSGERLLDLFDVYLACEEVPEIQRRSLTENADVATMYLLNAYQPRDLWGPEQTSGGRVLCERLRGLIEYANEEELESQRLDELKGAVDDFERLEERIIGLEQRIMKELAARARYGGGALRP